MAAAAPSTAPAWAHSPEADKLRRQMGSGITMKGYFAAKLPIAVLVGLRVDDVALEHATVSVPYKFLNQNPFQSMYFAIQAMAAELSTGTLAMVAARGAPEKVAVIITGMSAQFSKKATARTQFTCEDGVALLEGVDRALTTGEAVEVTVNTVGRMADGTEVSRFTFTWSFKKR